MQIQQVDTDKEHQRTALSICLKRAQVFPKQLACEVCLAWIALELVGSLSKVACSNQKMSSRASVGQMQNGHVMFVTYPKSVQLLRPTETL